MFLLDTEKYQLKWFERPTDVSYAIFSHVWSDDEQTFEETPLMQPNNGKGALRRGLDKAFRRPSLKIKKACEIARNNGFHWIWIDTCCIDKRNNTQLEEALNSMYLWYQRAAMCYAFLHDVPTNDNIVAPNSAFRRSVWFTRGWTLQELIAPHSVIFLSKEWQPIAYKWRQALLLEEVTGIDHLVLTHRRKLEEVSVACRMSWAAGRETKKIEDQAYSLMGIFNVVMPTIYGEGKYAFVRLQEAIFKKHGDQSIFAWGRVLEDHRAGKFVETAKEHDYAPQSQFETLFASSPADFQHCKDIKAIGYSELARRLDISPTVPEYTDTSFGLRTTLPLIPLASTSAVDASLALLACEDSQGRLVALYLRSHPRMSALASPKYYVGGFIGCGERRMYYYRAARVKLYGSHFEHTATFRQSSGRSTRVMVAPTWKLVHVHSHPDAMDRLQVPRVRSESGSSSASSTMVSFEPPCTIIIPQTSLNRLEALGYVVRDVPDRGFRLQSPGDHRALFFQGRESFTVHLGVQALDKRVSGSKASGQLWAAVEFHSQFDAIAQGLPSINVTPPSDVVPEESMLVQSWMHGRSTFGTKRKSVNLAFSYPCTTNCSLTDVYELDITYHGDYHRYAGGSLKRNGSVSTVQSRNGH